MTKAKEREGMTWDELFQKNKPTIADRLAKLDPVTRKRLKELLLELQSIVKKQIGE